MLTQIAHTALGNCNLPYVCPTPPPACLQRACAYIHCHRGHQSWVNRPPHTSVVPSLPPLAVLFCYIVAHRTVCQPSAHTTGRSRAVPTGSRRCAACQVVCVLLAVERRRVKAGHCHPLGPGRSRVAHALQLLPQLLKGRPGAEQCRTTKSEQRPCSRSAHAPAQWRLVAPSRGMYRYMASCQRNGYVRTTCRCAGSTPHANTPSAHKETSRGAPPRTRVSYRGRRVIMHDDMMT